MIYLDRGDQEVCYIIVHHQCQLAIQPMSDLPLDLAMIPVMPLTQFMGPKEGERKGRERREGETGKKNQIVLFNNNSI